VRIQDADLLQQNCTHRLNTHVGKKQIHSRQS